MLSDDSLLDLSIKIKSLAIEHGFQQARISDLDTSDYFSNYQSWIDDGFNGDMGYLARNLELRQDPSQLHLGSCRVISLSYNYLPPDAKFSEVLSNPNLANISRYALGRDYHKLMRKKLKKLAEAIKIHCQQLNYRVLVDSAPLLETCFAEKSGLGWKGKHTLLINKQAGSWFFLGEILINIELPTDQATDNLCGECNSCINLCPTGAIIAPYKLDARKCISYLTIENQGPIPLEYRDLIGNRIYGCDDCQLACPWNRQASLTAETDFKPRYQLDNSGLVDLLNWSEDDFNQRLAGNPIRRIGFQLWQRNIAVGLGNSSYSQAAVEALEARKSDASDLVKEHIEWAITKLNRKKDKAYVTSAKTSKLIRAISKMLPRDA